MQEKTVNNIFLRGLNVRNDRRAATLLLTEMAVLTALVVVLQILGSFIRFGVFSISLVLVPIVVGAALYGPLAGAWLGLVFGVVVLASGDAAPFFAVNPAGTVLVVLLKGTLCGFLSGIVYRLIEKKNRLAAAISAAAVCPIVNTGVFLIGCVLFFLPTIEAWGAEAGYSSAAAYMFLGLAGGNFLFELLFNLVLAPAIHRILILIQDKVRSRTAKRTKDA